MIKSKINEIKTWHFLTSSTRFNVVKLSCEGKEQILIFATAKKMI